MVIGENNPEWDEWTRSTKVQKGRAEGGGIGEGREGAGEREGGTLTAAVRWWSEGSAQEPAAAVVAEVAATAAASAVAAAAGPGLRAAIAGTGEGCWRHELSFVSRLNIRAAGDSGRPLEDSVRPWTDVLGESVSYPLSVLDQVVSMMQSDDSEARQGDEGGWLEDGRAASHRNQPISLPATPPVVPWKVEGLSSLMSVSGGALWRVVWREVPEARQD